MAADEHEIEFGELTPEGTLTNVRHIKQADVMACPHFILMPEHYRDDGSCRCNDPEAAVMEEWGYAWADGMWR